MMRKPHKIKMSRENECGKKFIRMQQSALYLSANPLGLALIQLLILLTACLLFNLSHLAGAQQRAASFPGVARDLISFCSARPSLSIDLAPMIVHVKRNTSFNYKLYLFSNTEYVFQTGQVVPRDDFRIHSFPVKLKQLNEFISPARDKLIEIYQTQVSSALGGQQQQQLVSVANSSFNLGSFLAQVPMSEHDDDDDDKYVIRDNRVPPVKRTRTTSGLVLNEPESVAINLTRKFKDDRRTMMTFDVYSGDGLPGDESFEHHDVATSNNKMSTQNANEHIQFDRDDQIALVTSNPSQRLTRELLATSDANHKRVPLAHKHPQQLVTPVGSFSSFHVNSTYLVRKDFAQTHAQVIRLLVDANQFKVSQVHLLSGFPKVSNATGAKQSMLPVISEDYAFLAHKLLRDIGTRITSITQIYEDWITRNFYTIVYIQRKLASGLLDRKFERLGRASEEIAINSELITDRLIFRGSSAVLLGADQLDYHVKASAFVTEKNGLHYYLEFLPNGKFYLGAIDWTKRPFRFLDSRGLPIKSTRTQFDNEELLLCPPSVCYSDQPVDEIISYGRLATADNIQRDASILTRSSTSSNGVTQTDRQIINKLVPTLMASSGKLKNLTAQDHELLLVSSKLSTDTPDQHQDQNLRHTTTTTTTTAITKPLENEIKTITSYQSLESISLDSIILAVRAGSYGLTTKLHLRDWVWSLARSMPPSVNLNVSNKFIWHYEWAKRNEIKVIQDTYGFALTGQEIDASYRVFNELYLISANQLITINYTSPNETVTSVHPIEEEFPGLSSSLLDPITGVFYDRYSNQIYFIKGDRYVGFDYATKKPLEDFLLPSGAELPDSGGGGTTITTRLPALVAVGLDVMGRPLVSSLPVVGLLGRQHAVDAIYHDLLDDLVYVFSGMKFTTYQASDFKEGAFRPRLPSVGHEQPPMLCINEHFLTGCRFDEAYPNPCTSEPLKQVPATGEPGKSSSAQSIDLVGNVAGPRSINSSQIEREKDNNSNDINDNNFGDEQQMKLRSIAARGRSGRLFDFLLENTLIAQGATRALEPYLVARGGSGGGTTSGVMPNESSYVMLAQSSSTVQERIVIYLLIAMVFITIMVTVAMIIVILNTWSRNDHSGSSEEVNRKEELKDQKPAEPAAGQAHLLEERIAYPPAISQYLTNQYHQQKLQQQQRHHRSSRDHFPSTRRSIAQMPLPSPPPPPTGPKPAARIPFRSYITSGVSELGPLGPYNPDEIIDSSAL